VVLTFEATTIPIFVALEVICQTRHDSVMMFARTDLSSANLACPATVSALLVGLSRVEHRWRRRTRRRASRWFDWQPKDGLQTLLLLGRFSTYFFRCLKASAAKSLSASHADRCSYGCWRAVEVNCKSAGRAEEIRYLPFLDLGYLQSPA
jgi:hypothetical protein